MLWTAILTVVSIAAVLWAYRGDAVGRKATIVSLLVTVVGTLIGVFLALDLSQRTTDRADRDMYNAMVTVAIREAEQKRDYMKETYNVVKNSSDGFAELVASERPAASMTIARALLSSDNFHRHSTPQLSSALITAAENSDLVVAAINASASKPTELREYVLAAIAIHEFARQVLVLQQRLTSGALSRAAAENEAKSLYERYLQVGNVAFLPPDVPPQ